jgi:putative protease
VAASLPREIGVVTHYYPRPRAAVIRLETGELAEGDTIHVRGHTTDFYQRVEHLERDHAPVRRAGVGEEIAVQVSQRVREGDAVYRLSTSDPGS